MNLSKTCHIYTHLIPDVITSAVIYTASLYNNGNAVTASSPNLLLELLSVDDGIYQSHTLRLLQKTLANYCP